MGHSTFFWQGYRAALPLIVGVMPFGIVFGAMARPAGMAPLEAVGMSFFVFAGSAQFVVTQLLSNGASLLLILSITFLINLRNFLYSASLAPLFSPLSGPVKWLLAFPVVDETYALIIARSHRQDLTAPQLAWFAAGVSLNLMIIWLGATALGSMMSDLMPPELTETLGFTLPLIFTGFIGSMLISGPARLAAATAALVAIVLAPLPYHLGLLIAALLGLGTAVLAEKWQNLEPELSAL